VSEEAREAFMASDWEEIAKHQRALQRQFESLLPDTSYINSIRRNFELMSKVVRPHQQLISQLNDFKRLNNTPAISQMRQIADSITRNLPDYSDSFLISSSVMEAFRHSTLTVPDYLSEFAKTSKGVVESTNVFSSELKALTKLDAPNRIVFDSLPDLLISPVVSGTAHYRALHSLDFVDFELNDETEEEYTKILEESDKEADYKIDSTNKDWMILLQGAEQSLSSRNPDKVRHAITSLRELMTQILHRFAPDDEVKKAFEDPQLFHEGRPTRRARIKYILISKYNNDSLLNVLDKDAAACIDLFNLYQEGTHRIVTTLNDEELRFIVKRTKLFVEQLIP